MASRTRSVKGSPYKNVLLYLTGQGKDSMQETVSALKSDQSLKTTIGEDTELCIPIWHTARARFFSST
jgi:hypothetical protein